MIIFKKLVTIVLPCMLALASCGRSEKPVLQTNLPGAQSNPVVYFEIPVTDVYRAMKFYNAVFAFEFQRDVIDHNEMALFPFAATRAGISGALVKGEIYKPTVDGVIIYFHTSNIRETLRRAVANGGEMLYPVTDNGLGLVAEFKDTEGNRIALYQPAIPAG